MQTCPFASTQDSIEGSDDSFVRKGAADPVEMMAIDSDEVSEEASSTSTATSRGNSGYDSIVGSMMIDE